MVLVLSALLVAAGVWAWFARDTSRAVRITAFGVAAAGIALLMFAIVLDRLN
jgi:ABC-type proline/glycine betaine transport system permease subunit